MSPKYKLPVEVSEHVQKIRALVQRDKQLQKNMRFMGNLPKAVYKRILAGAKFFYHPGTADNGNGTAMDAAWRGVPTLSNDYKAMRYIEESLHLGMRFFDSSDVDSIVTALFEAENSLEAFAAGVPSPEALFAHSVESDGVAATIYRTVLEASGLQAWRSAP